jgi:SnoaL-like protein
MSRRRAAHRNRRASRRHTRASIASDHPLDIDGRRNRVCRTSNAANSRTCRREGSVDGAGRCLEPRRPRGVHGRLLEVARSRLFSSGTETRGWQPTLDRYRAAYQGEGKQMGTLDFPQLDLVMLGSEAALVRARWRLKMSDGKESTGMTSVIFRKLPEGWRIVHDHSSAGSS